MKKFVLLYGLLIFPSFVFAQKNKLRTMDFIPEDTLVFNQAVDTYTGKKIYTPTREKLSDFLSNPGVEKEAIFKELNKEEARKAGMAIPEDKKYMLIELIGAKGINKYFYIPSPYNVPHALEVKRPVNRQQVPQPKESSPLADDSLPQKPLEQNCIPAGSSNVHGGNSSARKKYPICFATDNLASEQEKRNHYLKQFIKLKENMKNSNKFYWQVVEKCINEKKCIGDVCVDVKKGNCSNELIALSRENNAPVDSSVIYKHFLNQISDLKPEDRDAVINILTAFGEFRGIRTDTEDESSALMATVFEGLKTRTNYFAANHKKYGKPPVDILDTAISFGHYHAWKPDDVNFTKLLGMSDDVGDVGYNTLKKSIASYVDWKEGKIKFKTKQYYNPNSKFTEVNEQNPLPPFYANPPKGNFNHYDTYNRSGWVGNKTNRVKLAAEINGKTIDLSNKKYGTAYYGYNTSLKSLGYIIPDNKRFSEQVK